MALLPFGSPPAPVATRTIKGKNLLGAFCYNLIPSGITVQVPSGQTMLQVGDLKVQGNLDLTLGDLYWVD